MKYYLSTYGDGLIGNISYSAWHKSKFYVKLIIVHKRNLYSSIIPLKDHGIIHSTLNLMDFIKDKNLIYYDSELI